MDDRDKDIRVLNYIIEKDGSCPSFTGLVEKCLDCPVDWRNGGGCATLVPGRQLKKAAENKLKQLQEETKNG